MFELVIRLASKAQRNFARLAAAATCSLVVGCGGGGGGGGGGADASGPPGASPPTGVAAPLATQITLQSDPGDPIGQGRAYAYTLANARIQLTQQAGRLSVVVTGDEDWQGDFQIPAGVTPMVARYDGVPRYPQADAARASMRWFGGGRGCATSTGWFAVDHVDLSSSGHPHALVLRFERRCDGATAALRGEIRWLTSDATLPPAIVQPPPDSLWKPPAGATPARGNYLYVQSESGDYVGQGRSALYTPRTALFHGSGAADTFELFVTGAQRWYGVIQGRIDTFSLKPGHYVELTRQPFANPTRGGLSWVSDGRGCTDQRGWMVIDDIQYDAQRFFVTAITYRFEQRCVEGTAVLRGAVRWSAADAAAPTTPSPSQPAATWQPPATALPAEGNLLYLDSEPGELIGGGVERVFTPLDAVITVEESDGRALIGVDGVFGWRIDLRAEAAPSTLRPGVFSSLPRAFNPVNDHQPHFSLAGGAGACGESQSWLAIDAATYTAGRLTALDLRFEQRCAGAMGAARGLLRWRADDGRLPAGPGPIVSKAAWRPLTGAVPAAGNYLLINSSRYDLMGGGLQAVYTPLEARFLARAQGPELTLDVQGDDTWRLVFKGIEGQTRLTTGTYAAVSRWPFHSPARGGMDVGLHGSPGANSLQGHFIIDAIEHDAQGQLTALQMRFEQHIEGSLSGAVWGELRWSAADATLPPGPVSPPPAGLWAPPASATPATGSYLYFESEAGEFVGGGLTRLFTTPAARITATPTPLGLGTALLTVDTGIISPWSLSLGQMLGQPRLQPGYYAVPFAFPFQNPAKGGLSFSGDGRGCNEVGGWFVIDSISYTGDTISAVKLRFEQNCEGSGLLRGELVLRP